MVRGAISTFFTMLLPILVLVVIYFNTIGPDRTYPLPIALTLVSVMLGFMVLGVVAHELGHAGAALLLGKRVQAISVLWVRLAHQGGAWRFSRLPGGTAPVGSVHVDGYELSRRGVRDYLMIVAAGPVAEAAFTATMLIAASMIDGWLRFSFQVAGFWSVLSVLRNVLPFNAGSDGAMLLTLGRWRDNAIDLIAMRDWTGLLDGAAAPRDWPPAIVEQMRACLTRPVQRVAWQVDAALVSGVALYLHDADGGDWRRAEHVSQRLFVSAQLPVTGVNRELRTGSFTVNAIDLALRRNDPVNASKVLRLVPSDAPMARDALYVGAQAAIALAEGANDAAIGLARAALASATPETERIGANRVQTRWWTEVVERATAAKCAAKPILRQPQPTFDRLGDDTAWAWSSASRPSALAREPLVSA